MLADVTPEMPAFAEEIFGPVAPAQALVNAVYTGDELRGLAFAQRVRCGMVHVNDAMGRPTGESDLDELTTRRWIGVQRTPLDYPL